MQSDTSTQLLAAYSHADIFTADRQLWQQQICLLHFIEKT